MYFLISCVWKTICSHVWAHHVLAWCQQSLEENTRLSETGVMSVLRATLWVLGIHPGSFLRVPSSSHHWPISPAPGVYFVGFFFFFFFFFIIFISLENCLSSFYGSQHSISECTQLVFQVSFTRCHPTGLLWTLCASHHLNIFLLLTRNPASNTLDLLSTLILLLDKWRNRAHPWSFDLFIELRSSRWDFYIQALNSMPYSRRTPVA